MPLLTHSPRQDYTIIDSSALDRDPEDTGPAFELVVTLTPTPTPSPEKAKRKLVFVNCSPPDTPSSAETPAHGIPRAPVSPKVERPSAARRTASRTTTPTTNHQSSRPRSRASKTDPGPPTRQCVPQAPLSVACPAETGAFKKPSPGEVQDV
ncbi:hypothetical protein IAR50_005921 [Cryptococcus sp. DSM 104548]